MCGSLKAPQKQENQGQLKVYSAPVRRTLNFGFPHFGP